MSKYTTQKYCIIITSSGEIPTISVVDGRSISSLYIKPLQLSAKAPRTGYHLILLIPPRTVLTWRQTVIDRGERQSFSTTIKSSKKLCLEQKERKRVIFVSIIAMTSEGGPIKIVVCGPVKSGKTSIANFVAGHSEQIGNPNETYEATVGVRCKKNVPASASPAAAVCIFRSSSLLAWWSRIQAYYDGLTLTRYRRDCILLGGERQQ